jgi:hypothetical protein
MGRAVAHREVVEEIDRTAGAASFPRDACDFKSKAAIDTALLDDVRILSLSCGRGQRGESNGTLRSCLSR